MFRGKVVFAHAGTLHHIDMLFYVFSQFAKYVYTCVCALNMPVYNLKTAVT